MIFYNKPLQRINKQSKILPLASFSGGVNSVFDDSVLPLKYAKMSYNFDHKSGALKGGSGLEEFTLNFQGANIALKLPQGISAVKSYYYRRYDYDFNEQSDMIIVYATDKNCYRLHLNDLSGQFELIENFSFSTAPDALNYKYNSQDVMLFSTKQDGLKVYFADQPHLDVAGAPQITSMCLHYERVFATTGGEKTALWFSDDFDPTNWYVSLDEAGFIDLPGERGALLKVVSFLDYVYVFRSYGITRISAFADQTEFAATELYVSSGKIIASSVTICGDRIIFLAEDGLYQFDGIYTRRILEGYDNLICAKTLSQAKGVFCGGIFYLSLDMMISGKEKRALITYDIAEKSSYIGTLPIDEICHISADGFSKLLMVSGGRLCQLSKRAAVLGLPLKKVWESPSTDLSGSGEVKIIKKLRLNLEGRCRLKIISEREQKVFELIGRKGYAEIKTNIRGNVFKFIFESGYLNTVIARPIIFFDILN